MTRFPHEPIDAVKVAKARLGTLDTSGQQNVTENAFTDLREESEMEIAFEQTPSDES